jgi:flavin reductase (DIM6/NTAB) family NADH-FMN oxidoreductase RutF
MFYEPKYGHGLPHNPIQGCVVPRPIGWISTKSALGKANLSPYSHFNIVGMLPPMVAFCSNGPHAEGPMKDSAANAIETGVFVHNVATFELREKVVASSAHFPRDVDEFERVGLAKAECRLVDVPRVKESPIAFECRVVKVVTLPTSMQHAENTMIIGEIVGVHIDENVLRNGVVDSQLLQPLARMGYLEYATLGEIFEVNRPDSLLAKY